MHVVTFSEPLGECCAYLPPCALSSVQADRRRVPARDVPRAHPTMSRSALERFELANQRQKIKDQHAKAAAAAAAAAELEGPPTLQPVGPMLVQGYGGVPYVPAAANYPQQVATAPSESRVHVGISANDGRQITSAPRLDTPTIAHLAENRPLTSDGLDRSSLWGCSALFWDRATARWPTTARR